MRELEHWLLEWRSHTSTARAVDAGASKLTHAETVMPGADVASERIGLLCALSVSDGATLGYAKVIAYPSERMLLSDLYVVQTLRGQGIGGRLHEAAATYACISGFREMHLYAASSWGQHALTQPQLRGWYGRQGWQVVDVDDEDYDTHEDDHVLMSLDLDAWWAHKLDRSKVLGKAGTPT